MACHALASGRPEDPAVPPLISIVMPARNAAPWIGDTLRSVVGQSLADWECIVADDGSTDGTAALAAAFADPRITVLTLDGGGVSAARNAALGQARGELVAFLDADDLWDPQALRLLSAPLLADPEPVLAWADFVRFEDGTCRELPLPGTRLWMTGDAWADTLVDSFIAFGAFIVRAEAAKAVGFDTTLRIGEDRDWLLRVLKGRKAVHVPRTLHYYRQRPGSAIRDARRFLEDEERMVLRHLAAGDVPPGLHRRALSALAFHRAVLLARLPGQRLAAGRQLLTAIRLAPLYCENYLRPLRKLYRALLPARPVRLPAGGSSGTGDGT